MKYLLPLTAVIGTVTLIVIVAFYDTIKMLLLYAGWGVLSFAGLVALIVLVIGGLIGSEKWLTIRAKRRQAEAEATKAELDANTVHSAGDAWIRETIRYIEDGVIKTRVEYARLGGTRLRVNGHDHIPTESERLYASTLQTTGQTKMLAAGQILPQLPPAIALLPILDSAERVLIEGPPDAGKTTVCLHIAVRSEGTVIVIDPHNEPGKWPEGARIVGGGRNFAQILKFIDWMIEELDRRAKMADSGNTDFKPITIIIDELPTLILNCGKEVSRSLAMMIIESRKFKFRIFIGAQSKLLKLLGLEGMGDVRRGLVMVHLGYDQLTKQRVSTVDMGSGEETCFFPPYQAPAQLNGSGEAVKVPDFISQLSDEEQTVAEMLANKENRSAIARKLFGSAGGNQLAKVDEIIKRIS